MTPNIDHNKHYKAKELCEVLNVKYTSKNPSRAITEIERHYEIERLPNKTYRVVKELSEDDKIEKWKVTQYRKLFKDIVYTVLSCSEDNSILQADDEFMLLFHMVNKNFKMFTRNYINEKRTQFLNENGKDTNFEADALYFAQEVRSMLKQILNTTFNKMEEENLIHIKKHIMFGSYRYYTSPSGQKMVYTEPTLATKDEIEQLMEAETKVLEENDLLGTYKSLSDIPDYKLKCSLRTQISNRLGIAYYRTDKELILNRYGLKYKVDNDKNLTDLKRHLNKGTINKILNSNQGRLKEMERYLKDELAQLLIENHTEKTLCLK